ncbi:uncharacterized protein G2W53_044236 [Senna tora]|uniref:Uncharacterized protein n=1 Tax=Senna tora TaxID=362788 RepID=A0A834SMJ1_9FABA|nr:uncharacterized protein G2W53_044236 [Senna tora]
MALASQSTKPLLQTPFISSSPLSKHSQSGLHRFPHASNYYY